MNGYISTSALYSPYLAHHGIKGQKWGVRRYQNSDGSLTAAGLLRYGNANNPSYYRNKAQMHEQKIDSSKTRFGKNYHNLRAYVNEVVASRKNLSKKERHSFSENLGYGASARTNQAMSDYYSRKAKYSKTKLGKKYNEAQAYNTKKYAEASVAVKQARGKQKISKIIDAEFRTPVKTTFGRDTTRGKILVGDLLMAILW